MSQKLPVIGFEWIEDISNLAESFMKNIMKKVMKDIFLMTFAIIYHFYLKQ